LFTLHVLCLFHPSVIYRILLPDKSLCALPSERILHTAEILLSSHRHRLPTNTNTIRRNDRRLLPDSLLLSRDLTWDPSCGCKLDLVGLWGPWFHEAPQISKDAAVGLEASVMRDMRLE